MQTVITLENKDYPSLNKTLRMHWTVRKKFQQRLQWIIKAQTNNRHEGKVTITLQRYAIRSMDLDNLIGALKDLMDALRKNKVIKEDNPAIVTSIIPQITKVHKRAEEKTIILIED